MCIIDICIEGMYIWQLHGSCVYWTVARKLCILDSCTEGIMLDSCTECVYIEQLQKGVYIE